MEYPGRRSGSPRVLGGGLLALILLVANAAMSEPWSYDLAGELMSPYCPGRTVASCPSPQAAELIQWMVLQESGGATRQQVIDMLVERFGEEILGAPPAKGITLWAYIFPLLGFVIGGVIAIVVLRRIVRSRDAALPRPGLQYAVTTGQPIEDADLARLVDDDLAARG